MAELRWHPLIQDWVMINSKRQGRPAMPKDWCPFCPGSGKVPEDYDVLKYDNDFPALSQTPPEPDNVATDFFKVKPAYGKCEVILYSPGHTTTIPELSDQHMNKLINLWAQRYEEISSDPNIKYVFIFENRGKMVGTTMPHPHGQIYGYSVIPKKIQLELASAQEYREEKGRCLFCDMLKAEREAGQRIVFETEHFAVFLPFFTEYPYGVYLQAKRHVSHISHLTEEEKTDLGIAIKHLVGMFDTLFHKEFPYMMCMHNAPVNVEDVDEAFHFHIEFFPPLRSAEQQKFNASSETGVWAHCNPRCPEETAQELRDAYREHMSTLEK